MSKKRRGIVSVSMSLLEGWMHLPTGTHVVDVRRREGAPFGEFEVLIEGDAIPETPECETTPYMQCTVTIAEPQISFHIIEPRQAAEVAGESGEVATLSGSIAATCIDFGPVKVFPDGGIERTDKFTTTDAAALDFWAAVERFMPLKPNDEHEVKT